MKVVIDEGVPRQMVKALNERDINASKFPAESAGKRNGDLIRTLDNLGFDVLLTNDKNIASQQSLRGRSLAVVALPHNKRRAILERTANFPNMLPPLVVSSTASIPPPIKEIAVSPYSYNLSKASSSIAHVLHIFLQYIIFLTDLYFPNYIKN